jgi:hypothetical protein
MNRMMCRGLLQAISVMTLLALGAGSSYAQQAQPPQQAGGYRGQPYNPGPLSFGGYENPPGPAPYQQGGIPNDGGNDHGGGGGGNGGGAGGHR